MLENVKLDIIYYNTPKDFEVEFNLCGCCRMRLLTAVANDMKSFVSAMKTAVARSRVVLLCGELYGDGGLLNIISKAIGRELEEVDNSVYGIAGEGKTRLLKQSIPLVTSKGTLMGCVIEQGPQAIIIISEDKNGRKEIMQNLIHPYIKELSKSEPVTTSQPQSETVKSEPVLDQNPELQVSEELSPVLEDDAAENVPEEEAATNDTEAVAEAVILPEDSGEEDLELETVSPEDFCDSEEQTEEIEPENELQTDNEIEPENQVEETDGNAEAEQDDDTSIDFTPSQPDLILNNGLVFSDAENDDEDSDTTVFSADVFKQYNESFSLISPVSQSNKRHKHGRASKSSPIILILLCLILCLLGVLVYFLFVKPSQAGIDIAENFNNLFSFALRGVYKLW